MSSQLISLGSVGASAASAASIGAGKDGVPKTLMDVFAALLSGATGETGATIGQSSTTELNGLGLGEVAQNVKVGLLGQPGEVAAASVEVGAVVVAPQLSLVELLDKIEVALKAGERVDPELLKKLGEVSDAIVSLLGQAEITTKVPVGSVSFEIAATGAVGETGVAPEVDPGEPALKALTDKLAALGEKLASVDDDLPQRLVALAEKLDTARTAIVDLVEEMPALKALIGDLAPRMDAKVATTVVTTPALAAPALRLPENASLSAKESAGSAAEPAPALVSNERSLESDTADEPVFPIKAEARADVKADMKTRADQPMSAAGADKRDVPAQPAVPPVASPDVSVVGVTPQQGDSGPLRSVQAQVAYQLPAPINLPHMAFEIARQVQQGVSKFQIRLDPPELGRIDVKLDMDQSGQVNAKLVVERSETLDLLQRDQRALERALAQAGLDASKTNLEFSLKQNPFAGQDGKGGHQAGSPFGDGRVPVIADTEPTIPTTVYRGTASAVGVNIFV